MADQYELFDRLEQMIGNLGDHILQRAVEIAEPRIAAAETEAADRVAEAQWTANARVERAEALVEELRRQIGSVTKSNERLHEENKQLRAMLTRRGESS